MKARILVAAVCIPLLLVVMLVCPSWATALLMAVISAGCAYELLWKSGMVKQVRIVAISSAMGLAVSLWSCFGGGMLLFALLLVYVLWLFLELVLAKLSLSFATMCAAIFSGALLPLLFAAVVRIRAAQNGVFYVLVPFVMTMVPDAGAYFVGSKYGKKKLITAISPNKTVEGVWGGIGSGVLGMLLYAVVLSLLGFKVNYLLAVLYGAIGALLSMLGDLVFSTVKRQCGIKDFSNLLPGHGGLLDRFDSLLPVAPAAELLLLLLPFAER